MNEGCNRLDANLPEKVLKKLSEVKRALWQPRLPLCEEQCGSCPFKLDNDEEFRQVLIALAKAKDEPTSRITQRYANRQRGIIMHDMMQIGSGEFYCHKSVYNADMTEKPRHEWRQCKGAFDFFREYESKR